MHVPYYTFCPRLQSVVSGGGSWKILQSCSFAIRHAKKGESKRSRFLFIMAYYSHLTSIPLQWLNNNAVHIGIITRLETVQRNTIREAIQNKKCWYFRTLSEKGREGVGINPYFFIRIIWDPTLTEGGAKLLFPKSKLLNDLKKNLLNQT